MKTALLILLLSLTLSFTAKAQAQVMSEREVWPKADVYAAFQPKPGTLLDKYLQLLYSKHGQYFEMRLLGDASSWLNDPVTPLDKAGAAAREKPEALHSLFHRKERDILEGGERMRRYQGRGTWTDYCFLALLNLGDEQFATAVAKEDQRTKASLRYLIPDIKQNYQDLLPLIPKTLEVFNSFFLNGGEKHPAELCGRWKSDVIETWYWVTDRYPDGRYAKKFYYYEEGDQEGEVWLEWGNWSVSEKTYQEQIIGSSLPSRRQEDWNQRWLRDLLSEWHVPRTEPGKVLWLDSDTFDYESRTEIRMTKHSPLATLVTPHPKLDITGSTINPPKAWKDTAKNNPSVPDWVLESTGVPRAEAVTK
jgi:hypothetical protein